MNRLRGAPLNEARTSIANDPNAANSAVCGWRITWSANAKTAGITMAARAALFSEARPGSSTRGRGIFIRCGRPPGRPSCHGPAAGPAGRAAPAAARAAGQRPCASPGPGFPPPLCGFRTWFARSYTASPAPRRRATGGTALLTTRARPGSSFCPSWVLFAGPGPVMLRFRRRRHVMECWVAGQWLQRSASGRDKASQAAQVDVRRAHSARVYDYWLGGKDNFAADREAAQEAIGANPGIVGDARANRAFLA